MRAAGDFLQSRWRGQAALPRLFWRDMLGLGTLANALVSFVALMAVAQGASGAAAVALHFAPTPFNLFLAACVVRHPQATPARRTAAVAWAALMMLV